MARSLLDGIDTSKPAAKKGKSANADKIKLLAAVVLLAVAVGVLAWYYVLSDAPPAAVPQHDEATIRALEQEQEKINQELKARGAITGGS